MSDERALPRRWASGRREGDALRLHANSYVTGKPYSAKMYRVADELRLEVGDTEETIDHWKQLIAEAERLWEEFGEKPE